MDTWPISVVTHEGWAFIGIPDRLGDGGPYRADSGFPTLEEIAGDEWLAEILSGLLPRTRVWAWWTRNELYGKTGLPRKTAPPQVDPRALKEVVVRRRFLQQPILSIVPADQREAQDVVLKWAGADTEEIPEFIWTAPDDAVWNLEAIDDYCDRREAWADMKVTVRQPAERVVVMFDNQVSCACPVGGADNVHDHLGQLARRWSLKLIPGPPDYAWATSRVVPAPAR